MLTTVVSENVESDVGVVVGSVDNWKEIAAECRGHATSLERNGATRQKKLSLFP